ncbi:hypothetical protein NN561_007972 [Cricetulus griseus]
MGTGRGLGRGRGPNRVFRRRGERNLRGRGPNAGLLRRAGLEGPGLGEETKGLDLQLGFHAARGGRGLRGGPWGGWDATRSGSWGLNVALRQPNCIQWLSRHPTPSGSSVHRGA